MTLPNDAWGLPLSTSEEAAEQYRLGVDRMLSYALGVDEALEHAIDLDPGFALAYSQLGLFYLFRGNGKRAAELANQAHELAGRATPREQRHVAILGATARGKASQAPALVDEHLRDTPRDAPILMQWFGANFYGGGVQKRERMLDKFDSLAPAYGDDWWFKSWHAFANHEMDQLETARILVQRSLELRRQNGQAAHAMSHVFFEEHDLTGGAGFLGEWLTEFPERAGFHRHLTWHQALFLLANGKHSDALALHDETIRPGADAQGDALGSVADAASLLWRCRLHDSAGGNGARHSDWQAIAELAESAFPKPGTAWVDVHRAMALAALGDDIGLGKLLDGLRQAADRGHTTAGSVVAPVVEALSAFGQGDYETAANGLSAVRNLLVALGGSNAQRDVFEETLVEAHLRAGQTEDAEELLRMRLERGATARDLFRMGRAQTAKREIEAAKQSFRRAAELWADGDMSAPELQALHKAAA
jgi:tetratricopeptide (TPR) repeat protein